MNNRLPRGLYAITDCRLIASGHLVEAVAAAIAGGATVIQYRDKNDDQARRLAEAQALLALCHAHGVPLLINDDVELALAVGADGVHLGRDDHACTTARKRLGPGAIIGISCYNESALANAAVAAGADYVAFGSFFPSTIKPDAVHASPDLLVETRRRLACPLVAIGGITPENGRLLVEAGADNLAVISGVFGQPDICVAARRYTELFDFPMSSREPRASAHIRNG